MYVFSSRLKVLRLSSGSRRLSGSEFQVDGPATAKNHSVSSAVRSSAIELCTVNCSHWLCVVCGCSMPSLVERSCAGSHTSWLSHWRWGLLITRKLLGQAGRATTTPSKLYSATRYYYYYYYYNYYSVTLRFADYSQTTRPSWEGNDHAKQAVLCYQVLLLLLLLLWSVFV